MKLTIFGATGRTGSRLVDQALAAGHDVTVLARNPSRVTLQHERLRVLRGDVLDPVAVEKAVIGQDAVVSCIGSTTRETPVTLYSAGMRNILRAMRANGVQRLVCISANPLVVGDGDVLFDRLVLKPIVRAIFKAPYADLARMEEEVRDSDLEWTILRPPRLTDRPHTGHYRTAINRNLPRGRFISRADLADAILKRLDDPASRHAAVSVAY
ncbi:MAG TPA: SDR family oxidoreductase [Ktedonobacterales bacterium]|nr:SDR family oxidoreductase [Ktedonobacterales bacterium]